MGKRLRGGGVPALRVAPIGDSNWGLVEPNADQPTTASDSKGVMGMSELTPCNYCNLRSIKRRAEANNQQVTLLNGQDVYVHPKAVDIKSLPHDQREQYWRAWLMAITDHCVC